MCILHWAKSSENLFVTRKEKQCVWSVMKAASEAAEHTSQMKARAGRASYVSADLLKKPDAGAKACVIWLSAMFTVFVKSVHG